MGIEFSFKFAKPSQVSVSASRQEMVGQLLRDIVEAAGDSPSLDAASAAYDRFGFRISGPPTAGCPVPPGGGGDEQADGGGAAVPDADAAALEEKAERLRKQVNIFICFILICGNETVHSFFSLGRGHLRQHGHGGGEP